MLMCLMRILFRFLGGVFVFSLSNHAQQRHAAITLKGRDEIKKKSMPGDYLFVRRHEYGMRVTWANLSV